MNRVLTAAMLLALPTTALAGDDGDMGVRVKISTAIFENIKGTSFDADDEEAGSATVSGPSLGGAPARLEVGYLFSPNYEAGLMFEYSGKTVTVEYDGEEDEGDTATTTAALVYAGYNRGISETMWIYAQGIGGVHMSNDGSDEEYKSNTTLYGAGAGVRFRPIKRASLDLGLEYMMGKSTSEYDGDEVDGYTKLGMLGVRTGVQVRF